MKVYTVTSTDDLDREPLDRCVIGSYTSRGRALDECVDYIMERIEIRPDLAWSMAKDENHPEAAQFFREKPLKDKPHLVDMVVGRGCVEKLREFLRDELGGQGCYYVYDGIDSWHFDVDENDVEGDLWHTVTWGDSDCEDPEFTTPYPETFTSEESAIREFYLYALDLKRQYEREVSEGFKPFVYDALRKQGKCQVDLADGCCVSCVLYHDDAKNIKE